MEEVILKAYREKFRRISKYLERILEEKATKEDIQDFYRTIGELNYVSMLVLQNLRTSEDIDEIIDITTEEMKIVSGYLDKIEEKYREKYQGVANRVSDLPVNELIQVYDIIKTIYINVLYSFQPIVALSDKEAGKNFFSLVTGVFLKVIRQSIEKEVILIESVYRGNSSKGNEELI